jgi:hypothetical protein
MTVASGAGTRHSFNTAAGPMFRGINVFMSWSREFEDPIPLPRGRQLTTLKDGADYIMKLPKAEQGLAEWRAATEALIMAAEGAGPLMHARVGMLRALNRRVERVFNPDRGASILKTASKLGLSIKRTATTE